MMIMIIYLIGFILVGSMSTIYIPLFGGFYKNEGDRFWWVLYL